MYEKMSNKKSGFGWSEVRADPTFSYWGRGGVCTKKRLAAEMKFRLNSFFVALVAQMVFSVADHTHMKYV